MTEQQQERLRPLPDETEHASALLRAVPSHESWQWASPQGQRFLAYMVELTGRGIPLAWLAKQLDMDPRQLYVALGRYRKASA